MMIQPAILMRILRCSEYALRQPGRQDTSRPREIVVITLYRKGSDRVRLHSELLHIALVAVCLFVAAGLSATFAAQKVEQARICESEFAGSGEMRIHVLNH